MRRGAWQTRDCLFCSDNLRVQSYTTIFNIVFISDGCFCHSDLFPTCILFVVLWVEFFPDNAPAPVVLVSLISKPLLVIKINILSHPAESSAVGALMCWIILCCYSANQVESDWTVCLPENVQKVLGADHHSGKSGGEQSSLKELLLVILLVFLYLNLSWYG